MTRTVKERFYYRYEDGKRVKHTVTPVLGEKAAHNGKVIYSLDFEVTPHQLRHTYITNLIHSSVDPKGRFVWLRKNKAFQSTERLQEKEYCITEPEFQQRAEKH